MPKIPNIPYLISEDDVDALSRLAQNEVGSEPQLKQHTGYVTDSVLNRLFSRRAYPDNISDVINQKAQYSKVDGDWRKNLPSAQQRTIDAVKRHLGELYATGNTSPYMQFLNPKLSTAGAMHAWGNGIVADPKTLHFGKHYYGLLPEQQLPQSVEINIPPGTLYPGMAADSIDRYAERERQGGLQPKPFVPAQKAIASQFLSSPTALPRSVVNKADEEALRAALWAGWDGLKSPVDDPATPSGTFDFPRSEGKGWQAPADAPPGQLDSSLYGWEGLWGALGGPRR